jgi:hypothetical protein
LFRALHVFVLAAPKEVVPRRHHNALVGNGFVDGALRHFHVRADVDAFHIDVNPRIRNCAFAFDSHRSTDHFQRRELAEWNLRAGWSGNDDLLECLEVFAKITIVTKIDAVALEAFHRRRQGHASQRHFEHFLHVADGKAVARDLVAIDVEFDVVAAHHALGEYAGRTRHLAGATGQLRSLSHDYGGLKFKPLPGAEAEARSVAKLLGNDTALRLGAEAREAELEAVQSPRVLHLATHGFFLSDQESKEANPTGLNWVFTLFGLPTQNDWENPLTRCGIALSGANHAKQIGDAIAEDGVLTGLEASLLHLQGTELAILSACDSSSGEVKNGEGVMSLQRAFRIAGAQTVLASHWKVSDTATSALMTEFIRRWRAGEQRVRAWREAQLTLLRSKDFSNPFFWSAFTLTGEWR